MKMNLNVYLFLIEILNEKMFISNFDHVVICDFPMTTQIQPYQYSSNQQQKMDVHFRFFIISKRVFDPLFMVTLTYPDFCEITILF